MPGKELVPVKPPVYVPWTRREVAIVALCMVGLWCGFAWAALHAVWACFVLGAVIVFNVWQIAREVRKWRRHGAR